ncbi:MAG TPA: hypothetical protein VGE72_07040 [Azospirillum sp.]
MTGVNWSVRQLVSRAHGCELAVAWRADGRWTWAVSVASDRVAAGVALSQQGAQEAAADAAARHARNDGSVQLTMF